MAEVGINIKTKTDGSIEVQKLGNEFDTTGNKGKASADKTSKGWDNVSSKSSGWVSSAKRLATSWVGVTAVIAGTVKLLKDSVSAFMAQEQAENDLSVAMKNAGTFTKQTVEELTKYAAALQKVTTYGDEVTISTMANLQSYGMSVAELKKATTATMDLATAKKIDLRTASELVGKAFVGETGTLSRYGIVLGKGIEESKKFEAVLGLINKRLGGAAQTDLNTYAGQVKQLSNWWGDVTEAIGFGLIKALTAALAMGGLVVTGFLGVCRA